MFISTLQRKWYLFRLNAFFADQAASKWNSCYSSPASLTSEPAWLAPPNVCSAIPRFSHSRIHSAEDNEEPAQC